MRSDGHRVRADDGRPARRTPLAGGAARTENATVVSERLREPYAIQRQERPGALSPHTRGRRPAAEEAGADYVLMPSVEEIYPEPDARQFDFGAVDKVMEGATRPGHFNGVAQVVSRLFRHRAAGPRLLRREGFPADRRHPRRMVRQLGLSPRNRRVSHRPWRGRPGPSSRNLLLDPAHRAAAPHIYAFAARGCRAFAYDDAGRTLLRGSRPRWSASRR